MAEYVTAEYEKVIGSLRDTVEALKYIGKPCYFTSEIGRFNVLEKYCDYGILEEVLDPALEPFQMASEDDETYQFIIPAEWCK